MGKTEVSMKFARARPGFPLPNSQPILEPTTIDELDIASSTCSPPPSFSDTVPVPIQRSSSLTSCASHTSLMSISMPGLAPRPKSAASTATSSSSSLNSCSAASTPVKYSPSKRPVCDTSIGYILCIPADPSSLRKKRKAKY